MLYVLKHLQISWWNIGICALKDGVLVNHEAKLKGGCEGE